MTRQWRNILLVLGVLIILFLINTLNQQKLISSSDNVFHVKEDQIFSFTIKMGDEEIELSRVDTLWVITGHDSLLVKSRIMSNFLEQSLKVKRETLVSTNPKKWSTYSVDDSLGSVLTVYGESGNEKGRAVFGRSKSEWSKNFVRIGNENKVYQTNKSIAHQLQISPTYWGETPKLPEPPAADTISVD